MDTSVPLLAFASLLGGMLVISRVSSWVALVVAALRSPSSGKGTWRAASVVTPLFLHSGPWVMALAVAAVCYASIHARSAYLWTIVSGLSFSAMIVGGLTAQSVWPHKHPNPAPQPLTPERLLAIERRFFWSGSLLFGIVPSALFAYDTWANATYGDLAFMIIIFFSGFAGGWLFSWFMWQWYGEELKMVEMTRLLRSSKNVV